jgi:large subunit ribosomal protein L7/L12
MSEETTAVAREWSNDIKELGDKIVSLSLLKAKELQDYIEQEHGLKAAAAAVAVAPGPGPADRGSEEAETVEKTQFNVVLKAIGEKKIQVIKALRANTDLGLREAKEIVEKAPTAVMQDVDKDAAEKAKKELEEAGATVTLE